MIFFKILVSMAILSVIFFLAIVALLIHALFKSQKPICFWRAITDYLLEKVEKIL